MYEPIGPPLFGESTRRDRLINVCVGGLTAIFVLETCVGAFMCPSTWTEKTKGLNVYLALCIACLLVSHLILIYWYRQGNLEPKFRTLVFYNAAVITMMCIGANCYVYLGGCGPSPSIPPTITSTRPSSGS